MRCFVLLHVTIWEWLRVSDSKSSWRDSRIGFFETTYISRIGWTFQSQSRLMSRFFVVEPSCGPFRNIHDLGGLPFSAPPYFANDFRYLGAAGSTTCDGFDQLIGIVPIRCHPLAAFKPAAVCQLNTKGRYCGLAPKWWESEAKNGL